MSKRNTQSPPPVLLELRQATVCKAYVQKPGDPRQWALSFLNLAPGAEVVEDTLGYVLRVDMADLKGMVCRAAGHKNKTAKLGPFTVKVFMTKSQKRPDILRRLRLDAWEAEKDTCEEEGASNG